MQLPKVILKIKAAVRGSWGLPSAAQPHGVGLFSPRILLYPPQIGVLLDQGTWRSWR